MGNRFAGLPEYHTLILAHGIIAAITFMFIVPTAILTASFYHRDPRFALRTHISLQVLTVILTTVIFVLGWLIHKVEKGKMRLHIPIKLMVSYTKP